jgi:tRNA (guanine-N7-)-methyltransferase
LLSVDAVWALEHLFGPGEVEELWTFFPDPWPKKRHHKRRLVTPGFAAIAASRLRPGGVWRLATDWAHYAGQMRGVLDAEPGLEGGTVPRWEDRPVTKFERKGLTAGRTITDLAYRRV